MAGCGLIIDAERLRKDLADREVPFSAVTGLMLRDKESSPSFTGRKGSHALVFDADGTCVFRGSGHEAAPHARAAFARHLIGKATGGEVPKALQPTAEALLAGRPPHEQLAKLYPLAISSDKVVAGPAKEILVTFTAPGQKALEEAKKQAKADPLGAFLLLEPHAGRYKGTAVGDNIAGTLENLKREPAVVAETRARAALEPIKKLDAALSGQAGAFDPTAAAFQQKHARSILELGLAVEAMKKKHPKAKATEQAEAIARKYGR